MQLQPQENRLDKLEKILKLSLLSLGLVVFGLIGYDAYHINKTLLSTLQSVNTTILNANTQITYISQNTNAILIQAGLAVNEARLTSSSERLYLQTMSKETIKTISDTDLAIVNLQKTEADIDTSLVSTSNQLSSVVADTKPLLQAGTKTLTSANKLLADPALAATLNNTNNATKSLAEVSANVSATTKDIQNKVHDMTKPASLLKTIFMKTLGIAANLKVLLF